MSTTRSWRARDWTGAKQHSVKEITSRVDDTLSILWLLQRDLSAFAPSWEKCPSYPNRSRNNRLLIKSTPLRRFRSQHCSMICDKNVSSNATFYTPLLWEFNGKHGFKTDEHNSTTKHESINQYVHRTTFSVQYCARNLRFWRQVGDGTHLWLVRTHP